MENSAHTTPSLAFKTVHGYIESLRKAKTLPSRIDSSTMQTLSGRNKIDVKSALRFLGLTTDDGTPTVTLRSLIEREGEEEKAVWRDFLAEAYPMLLGTGVEGFDLSNATPSLLNERFKKMGVSSGVVAKAQRFFLQAAEFAGIPISKYITDQRRAGRPSGASRPKPSKPTGANTEAKSSQPLTQIKKTDKASQPTTFEERMLQETGQLPPFDPEWDIEEKKLWYEQQRFLVSQWRGVQAPDLWDDETEDEL